MQMRQTFCFLLFISYKVCANLFGNAESGPLPVWHVLRRFCSPCVWICQISAPPVLWVAKAYWRAQGWGKGRRWTDRGDRPTPNQCNQTSYQSAIQSDGSPGQRRVGGRKRREDGCLLAFRCPHTSTFLCSPPSPQRWLWWNIDSDESNSLPMLYLKARPPEERPGDRRGRSYRKQPKQLHLNPEG